MMFHLEYYAVNEQTLDIVQATAHVEDDGHITYPSDSPREDRRAQLLYNSCDVFIYWWYGDTFGVQRLGLGAEEPQSLQRWRTRLFYKRYLARMVAKRVRDVRAVFVGERVSHRVLGWQLKNVKRIDFGRLIKISAKDECQVTP